jgi:glycosyltransferase involved in cell wall biosynthesis
MRDRAVSAELRRVLMLVPCDVFPPVDGNSMNIYNIMKYVPQTNRLSVLLSRVFSQGGAVDLVHENLDITYCPSSPFDRFRYKSFLFNPVYFRAADELMRKTQADIIQCQVLFTCLVGYLLKRKFRKPLVLVQENVEYLKYKRFGSAAPLAYSLRWLEEFGCRIADRIVAVSEADKQFMTEIYGVPDGKIEVAHHCADPELFRYDEEGRRAVRQMHGLSPDENVLTFVGKLDTIPNARAVRVIAERIYPAVLAKHPDTTFLVVGQNYEPLVGLGQERMIFTGFVSTRGDLHPNMTDYLSASDVVLIPLDSGSGTRLKILEAAACSRPILSTCIGAEGLEFQPGDEILLTPDVDDEFVDALLRLMDDRSWGERLGWAAREKVLARYSWEREVAKYDAIYQELESVAYAVA